MTPLRVAFLASTLEVGGAESVMLDLVSGLDPARVQSQVHLLRRLGRTGQLLRDRGAQIRADLYTRRWDPRVVPRLARQLRRFAPHVVFFLDHHDAIFWGGWSARWAGCRHWIVASHCTGRLGGKPNFRWSDRLHLDRMDRVVALSQSHRSYLIEREGIAPAKITIIPNGVDLARYSDVSPQEVSAIRQELGLEPDNPTITMVASLRPEKAHVLLLDAAAALRRNHPGLQVLIVGDGPERDRLEQRCHTLGLQSTVRFLGVRPDIPVILRVSDVVTLPSRPVVETLPLAVLEAMAASVPVVASRVGALPEVLAAGKSGELIDPGNGDQFFAALTRLLADPDYARRLAQNGRRTVEEKYSRAGMIESFHRLFAEVAGRTDG